MWVTSLSQIPSSTIRDQPYQTGLKAIHHSYLTRWAINPLCKPGVCIVSFGPPEGDRRCIRTSERTRGIGHL